MKSHVEELIEPEGKLMLRYWKMIDEHRSIAAGGLLEAKEMIADALLLDEADKVIAGSLKEEKPSPSEAKKIHAILQKPYLVTNDHTH